MEFITFKNSLFSWEEFKTKNDILKYTEKNILIAFNMNGCFGSTQEIFFGTGNENLVNFLYTNHFEVYCFKTDKDCISYFKTFKNEGVDMNIHIGPEEILVEKISKRFTKTGKPKKDKIEKVLNNKLEEIFNMPKIDLTIMNPPYEGSLHLEILEKIISKSEKIINISPVRWLQDPLAKYKNKKTDFIIYENSISKQIEELEVVPARIAQQKFGDVVMNMDLAIYTIGKGGFDYKSFSTNTILDKVFSKRILCNIEENKKDGWRIRIPKILGGKSGGCGNRTVKMNSLGKLLYFYDGMKENKPWYEWYGKNQYSKTTPEITCSIQMPSEKECKNFIYSIENTKFGKYVTHLLISDVNVSNLHILYMPSYKQKWTDKRFCEYFGITGYIDDDNAEKGSEWEIILKAIK